MKFHFSKIGALALGFVLLFAACGDGNFEFISEQITVVNETGAPLKATLVDQELAALLDPSSFITLKKDSPDILQPGDIMLFLRDEIPGKLDPDETLFVLLFSASPDFLRNNTPRVPVSEDELVLFYAGSLILTPSDLEKNDGFINVNFN